MDEYGGASQWETSVPIPNTAIKPLNADDSVKAKIGSCRTKKALNQGDTKEYGGASQWETSVPIPNTAIKPLNADDSVKAKIGSCRTKKALNQGDTKVQGFLYQGSGLFLFLSRSSLKFIKSLPLPEIKKKSWIPIHESRVLVLFQFFLLLCCHPGSVPGIQHVLQRRDCGERVIGIEEDTVGKQIRS